MNPDKNLLEILPVAVYTTDAEGRITFFNAAAAALWGVAPEVGVSRWCGSLRLFRPDGQPLLHEECPMAVTLREGYAVRGAEAVAERPDGSRVAFRPHPSLLKDPAGRTIGGINLMVESAPSARADIELARLAAIVSSSDDAIVSKTLDGTITSWNEGAMRLFGWAPDEIIGRPIWTIIPPDLEDEERRIIYRLRRGERVPHFDTERLTKDGRRVPVSLTISPLRDRTGTVVGASKIARDISDRRRNEEIQQRLIDELNHRVKNMLGSVQALASRTFHGIGPEGLVRSFSGRLAALARTHDLLVAGRMAGADIRDLVRGEVGRLPGIDGVALSGPPLLCDARVTMQLGMIVHELAMAAAEGAPATALAVAWELVGDPQSAIRLRWEQAGGSAPGDGGEIIRRTAAAAGGTAERAIEGGRAVWTIILSLTDEGGPAAVASASSAASAAAAAAAKRVLLIEDEAMIAMEMEFQLISAGYEVVGPAATLEKAQRLAADGGFNAAIIDANLGGKPVDSLAAMLTERGIPFAFATGYGREALPAGHQHVPLLAKPVGADELLAVVRDLLA